VSQTNDGATDAKTASPSLSMSRLNEILLASLTSLAAAGEVEAACRLAGQAFMALRSTDQVAARRFDALLHRLTPKLTDFVHRWHGSASVNPEPRNASPGTSSGHTESQ
jgi:hypothetical protein